MTAHAIFSMIRNMTGHNSHRKILFRGMVLAAAITFLQACVAVAIPAIAGGAIIRKETKSGDATPKEAATDPAQNSAATNPNAASTPPAIVQAPPAAQPDARTRDALDDGLAIEPIQSSKFHALAQYALNSLNEQNGRGPARSALLADPSKLDAQRLPCRPNKPAVLIDLDEKGGIFDPNSLAATYDGDAHGHLSRLRESGIAIGWISALTAEHAGAVRGALQISGLDVKGEDDLVLFRYSNDRKQTRRAEFGANYCLIAIAGDERADFDELYKYLTRPDAAIALEELIGSGWFLLQDGPTATDAATPNPATPNPARPDPATPQN